MSRKIDWKDWADGSFEEHRFSPDSDSTASIEDSVLQIPITLVFQDNETLACARPICDRLFRRFGPDSFRVSEWPLSTLGTAGVFARVFADVVDSDIVMLALRGDEPLPALIRAWVEAWEERRVAGTGVVVALFLCGEEFSKVSIAADEDLEAILKSAGLNYISQVIRRPSASQSPGAARLAEPVRIDAGAVSRMLFSPAPPGYGHWGLNE